MPRAERLRCSYGESGVVLGDLEPAFAWALADLEPGRAQLASQVLVATDPSLLRPGLADCWDSGRVEGAECETRYRGSPLRPRGRYCWSVRVWSDIGEVGELCEPAWFEIGLGSEGWRGGWIGFVGAYYGQALLLRRRFVLEGHGGIVSARAYVASAGWHQLRVNGERADERVLEPAQTVLSKRVICSTYPLEHLLTCGANVVGLVLGNGWHGAPCARVALYVEHADGTTESIGTERGGGPAWQVAPAAIVSNSPYEGEILDRRLERPRWDAPDLLDEGSLSHVPGADESLWTTLFGAPGSRERAWVSAQAVEGPPGELSFPGLPPARVTETNEVVGISEPTPGIWVVDAGSNGAGWLSISLGALAPGERVELRYSETLGKDGRVNQENLRSARCSDVLVGSGEAGGVFEPTFTCHGFRYAELRGLHTRPSEADVLVRRVRTPGLQRSRFQGEPLLEGIWEAVVRTEASNTLGALTDCPQRDERHGWLNDLTDRLETAALVHDIAPLLSKVLDDICDSQAPDGSIPDTVPFRWGHRVADPVCLAPVMIPRLVMRHWGDERIVLRGYQVARGWMQYLLGETEHGLLRRSHYGDWAEPKRVRELGGAGSRGAEPGTGELDMTDDRLPAADATSRRTPGTLVSTACLHGGLQELAKLAGHVGDLHGQERALGDAGRVRAAFERAFQDQGSGGYGSGSQGSLACAAYYGLVPAAELDHVVGMLADDVRRRGCLTTGNVATKLVLETLSDHGFHDLSLMLARREEYPSWGHMVRQGATTLWERWEEASGGGMNSHNHGMLGAIGSWLVTRHAGLRVAEDARGSDRWEIVVPRISGDAHAAAEIESPRGRVAVSWTRRSGRLEGSVCVPAGTVAMLRLPLRTAEFLPSGVEIATGKGETAGSLSGGTWTFGGACS